MSSSLIRTRSDVNLSRVEAESLGFDPQTQPLMPLAELPAIDEAYLNSDFIKKSFTQSVQWEAEPLLSDLVVPAFSHYPKHIPSAVCMPLVQREEGMTVLFTRRAGHLPSHPGQVCFPGGRIDLSDNNAVHTALRETHEEVGIAPGFVQPLGEHPIIIATRYAMRPVVSLLKEGFSVAPCANEVAQVFEVPLAVLMDPTIHRLHGLSQPNDTLRHYFSMSWNDYFIWGATAAVIRNFYHYLFAASTQLSR